MSFESSIKEIRKNRPQVYKTFTLDLSTARSEYELPIAGNYLVVIDATDLNTNIQLRFNEVSADALTLKKRQGWKIPFYRLYISNAAQAGLSITLAYGISETPLERIDQGSVVDIQSIADTVNVVSKGLARGRASNGVLTNPVNGQTVADSGALNAGTYRFKIIGGTSLAFGPSGVYLKHMDAANAAILFRYVFACNTFSYYDFTVDIAVGERMVADMNTAFTGKIHIVLSWEQLF